ncbi:ROK family protein [Cellvibrio fontiphilus]|uniref:fructokinase n=1 Tax=Cellvibrio fontiphilus TaxID=1815559 RepID=A0ABV7F9J8_9GAMM
MSREVQAVDAGLIGAIEAGGTKFNCALADAQGKVLAQAAFPTLTPEVTLAAVRDFFTANLQAHQATLAAIGIASFGPVELNRSAPQYGFITKTPKAGWSNTDVCGYFRAAFGVPIAFETDVNGAAWGELVAGAARDCSNFIYVTVGTGIGAGIVVNGKLLQGVTHPEVGHMLMPRASLQDDYQGCCPFHTGCLEGLASGTAINKRWGINGKDLPDDHAAWDYEAHYLATMCVNLTQCFAPQKIILGGGVMDKKLLFPLIRNKFLQLINGYAPESILARVDQFIVPTGLAGQAGIVGAIALAQQELQRG